MRGDKLFEIAVNGHINTKSNEKSIDYFDRMETLFSTLPRSMSLCSKISIDAKFWISSKRLRDTRALDLDNLIKPVLDHLTKMNVINDDANVFELKITKYPTDGEQLLRIEAWEWIANGN